MDFSLSAWRTPPVPSSALRIPPLPPSTLIPTSLSLSLLAQVPQKVRSELPETDFRRDPSADFAL